MTISGDVFLPLMRRILFERRAGLRESTPQLDVVPPETGSILKTQIVRYFYALTIILPLRLSESHVDYALLTRLEAAIHAGAGGKDKFKEAIPAMLRQAIDEVIDTARSKRFTLSELEKTEKTYLGTKVEILLRNALGAERGRHMDLTIDGVEVDVKNTIGSAWTIPNEALGHVCILISTNGSFGL